MNKQLDEETVLARFSQWLDETAAEAESIDDRRPAHDEPPELPSVGLLQFVEEFTALRHELKLETKSSRNLAERTETMLTAMEQAVEAFRSVDAREAEAARQAARPLIEAMLDLDEALGRGRAVIETARRRVLEDLTTQLQEQLDDLFRHQSLWRRWLCRHWYRAAREIVLQRATLDHRRIFDSLAEGYDLIVNRLGRAMKKEEIYRIQCVGKPANPNTMTVVEAVDDPRQPPGLVVEEIRPGYYRKGEVVRFAEVKAVAGK
ncbi:MAG TPA: nucleotide exchange factor GrpE [Thermoguttaceae bacterium]|nr:nucleotide exchange factor GrpE [Thermoguttaceae bacterium]